MATLNEATHEAAVWKLEATRLDGILKANYEVSSRMVEAMMRARKLLEGHQCNPSCDGTVEAALKFFKVFDP
jgi:hypothetical protein